MQTQFLVTRFGLIRHAETIWNQEKKIQGQHDSALTAAGRNQADRWGRILKRYSWKRIVASDTGRALETANIVNEALKIQLITDPRLREQDWGDWVGKTVSQIKTQQPVVLAKQESAGWDFCPPGGEDRKSVLARSKKALEDAAAKWGGDNLLIVTHEGVIKSLVYHLSGRKFLPGEPPFLKSYRLHCLIHDRDGLRLEQANALDLSGNRNGDS
jgi:probable phosphoglycerate mutase